MPVPAKPLILGAAAVGAIALLTGLALQLFGNARIVASILSNELSLRPDSVALKRWQTPPQPRRLGVYILNVTNPDEMMEGQNPDLEELGPYVFDQTTNKVDVVEEDGDTISYRTHTTLLFNEKASGSRKLSEPVTLLYVPLLAIVQTVEHLSPQLVDQLEDVLPSLFPGMKDVFMRATVADVLFEGIAIDCRSRDFILTMVCKVIESRSTNNIRKDGKIFRFSFLHHKNGTSKARYRVYRGTDELKNVTRVYSYDNMTSASLWGSPQCNMLNGTDGMQFPPLSDQKDPLYIYQPDMCRSLFIDFEKEMTRSGVTLHRYVNTKALFAAPQDNPNNACFCVEGFAVDPDEPPPKECPKAGSFLALPCMHAPMVVTFPHFYLGDEDFKNYSGLEPNKSLHEIFVDIEPTTGIPVSGAKRVQFNMEVKKMGIVPNGKKLQLGLLPILWMEETADMREELFSLLSGSISSVKTLQYITYAIIALGAAITTIAYLMYAKLQKQCCWEADVVDSARSNRIQAYDSHGFGPKGVYADKVDTGMSLYGQPVVSLNNSLPVSMNPHGLDMEGPVNRRQSKNSVSYVEHFM